MTQSTTFTVADLFAKALESHGFDCSYLYCLVTGKPVGYLFHEEIESIIPSLGEDLESAADDLAMRVVASMRPSIKWNRLRNNDLAELRKSAPVETMAYLLNRLFQSKGLPNNWLTEQTNRIRLFSLLLKSHQGNSESFNHVMEMLLEVEAKPGLAEQTSPVTIDSILALDWSTLYAELGAMLIGWHKKVIKAYDSALADAKFFAKNPGARRAFFDSFMESKPVTEKTVKQRAKTKSLNEITAILNEVMDMVPADKPMSQRVVVEPHTPKTFVRPVTKLSGGMKFGVKKTTQTGEA